MCDPDPPPPSHWLTVRELSQYTYGFDRLNDAHKELTSHLQVRGENERGAAIYEARIGLIRSFNTHSSARAPKACIYMCLLHVQKDVPGWRKAVEK